MVKTEGHRRVPLSDPKKCMDYTLSRPFAEGFEPSHSNLGTLGLQYAVQTGTHPAVTTERNINRFRQQLQALGFSYDWDRELSTTDPSYYKWTQWIFSQLFKKGLAYQAEVPVNWCPALGTVLANEEVIDGKSERGGHPVVRIPMKQVLFLYHLHHYK